MLSYAELDNMSEKQLIKKAKESFASIDIRIYTEGEDGGRCIMYVEEELFDAMDEVYSFSTGWEELGNGMYLLDDNGAGFKDAEAIKEKLIQVFGFALEEERITRCELRERITHWN